MTRPVDAAENERLRALLEVTRSRYADLLAAARATLSADRDGEDDPLYYLRDELTAHPTMPPLPGPTPDPRDAR